MPTPRPLMHRLDLQKLRSVKINRQVQRMQQLGTPPATKAPAAKQGLSGFTQKF